MQLLARWYKVTYGATFIPDEVMPRDVRDWKAYQQAIEKVAPATINQRLTAITCLFRWARSQGWCRENQAEDVSNIRLEPHQPKALDNLTLRKLLRVARSHPRDYAMLEMLGGTWCFTLAEVNRLCTRRKAGRPSKRSRMISI